MIRITVGLEQAAHERRVHVAIVRVKNRVGNVWRPALAAVSLIWLELCEAAGIPPDGERDRVERDLRVSLAWKKMRVQAE